MAPLARVTITIPCKLGWSQLDGYDNSGNSNSTMELSVEITQSREIKALEFTKIVTESSREEATKQGLDASVNATYGPVSASMSANTEHSTVLKDMLSSTTEVTREESSTSSTTVKKTFTVGPGDQMYFYQRLLTGPGISCILDRTMASYNANLESETTDTEMMIISTEKRFIKSMDVVYGNSETSAPDGHVREASGQSADVNKGKGGKYVWLVPSWTEFSDKAGTSLDILIQRHATAGWKDLAMGAEGDFRYVRTAQNGGIDGRIVDAKLIRSGHSLSAADQVKKMGSGWVGGARDINENRGGDFLYLAYKMY